MRWQGFALIGAWMLVAGGSAAAAVPELGTAAGGSPVPTGCVATPAAPLCSFACAAGVPFVMAGKSTGAGAGGAAYECGPGGSCAWAANDSAIFQTCASFSENSVASVGTCRVTGSAVAFCGA